jgi:hypothetical protein
MFATLAGTNTDSTRYKPVLERLCEIAVAHGFKLPDTKHRIRRDQLPLDGWTLELNGPHDGKAIFFLSVTAPKVPSMSPIPVMKTIDGPLFAVMVMDSFYVVSREDKRDVSEFKDNASVEKAFEEFLKNISIHSGSDKGLKIQNTYVQPIGTEDDSGIGNSKLCDICKKRPGKMEHRISPPMRMVEVCLCAECSRRTIY